jgi:hypothetical protein
MRAHTESLRDPGPRQRRHFAPWPFFFEKWRHANLPRPLFFKEGRQAGAFADIASRAARSYASPFEKGGLRGIRSCARSHAFEGGRQAAAFADIASQAARRSASPFEEGGLRGIRPCVRGHA